MACVQQYPCLRKPLIFLVSLYWSLAPCFISLARSQEALSVTINRISIEGVSVRDLTSSFPYPVFTFLSVVDGNGRPVRGLANSSKWVTAEEIAENGQPVSTIWSPLFEYDAAGPVRPESGNLYGQKPQPLVTELTSESAPPTSNMLLLDVTESLEDLGNPLELVREGANIFVDGMRPADRAGIIRFSCEIDTLEITDDKDLLRDFIDDTDQIRPWTPLYQAMLSAIDLLKNEDRLLRNVIVYTDGEDIVPPDEQQEGPNKRCPEIIIKRSSGITEDDVIAAAQTHGVRFFTIALGAETEREILMKVAEATGGEFFETSDGSDFPTIYSQISEITQHGYVMAHLAPESCGLVSERVVDVTVNVNSAAESATSHYTYSGSPRSYDLRVSKSSDLLTVQPGDDIGFSITVENLGPESAFNLTLTDTISAFWDVVGWPGAREGNILSLALETLPAFESATLSYTANLVENLPDSVLEIRSLTAIQAACESDQTNNIVSHALDVLRPSTHFDLALSKVVDVDTLFLDENFTYTIAVQNFGPATAKDFAVSDVLPPAVIPTEFSIQPQRTAGDTLTWEFTELVSASRREISFQARLEHGRIPTNQTLTIENHALIEAESDTNAANDLATASFVFAPLHGCEIFRLDRNVFRPASESPLSITMQIEAQDRVTLDVFDITGYHIKSLAAGLATFGSRTVPWDGSTQSGMQVGSGVYIIVLRVFEENRLAVECVQKVLVAR